MVGHTTEAPRAPSEDEVFGKITGCPDDGRADRPNPWAEGDGEGEVADAEGYADEDDGKADGGLQADAGESVWSGCGGVWWAVARQNGEIANEALDEQGQRGEGEKATEFEVVRQRRTRGRSEQNGGGDDPWFATDDAERHGSGMREG